MDLQEPMNLKDIQQLLEEDKLYSALAQISTFCDKQRCHGLLARQNLQQVPLEDQEVGRLEFIHGGAVNAANGGCGEGVANT